jgi:hypothetical protein
MDLRDAPPADGRPETLLAATILLMSAHARDGGPRLADAVLRHLELLAARDDLPGVLTATCDQAADLWVPLARPARPAAAASPAAAERPDAPAPRRGVPAFLRLVIG